jgi:DNA ligase-1
VKLKLEFVVDLKVKAIVPGDANGKNAGRAGSLTCTTDDEDLVVDVTVKNEAMRDEIDANPEAFVGGILKVLANGVMKPSASSDVHSLFLPRMVEACIRADKFEPDSLARVFAQQEAAIEGERLAEAA